MKSSRTVRCLAHDVINTGLPLSAWSQPTVAILSSGSPRVCRTLEMGDDRSHSTGLKECSTSLAKHQLSVDNCEVQGRWTLLEQKDLWKEPRGEVAPTLDVSSEEAGSWEGWAAGRLPEKSRTTGKGAWEPVEGSSLNHWGRFRSEHR